MTDPWDWYIYLHEYHKNPTIHVAKYTGPMDAKGKISIGISRFSMRPYGSKDPLLGMYFFGTIWGGGGAKYLLRRYLDPWREIHLQMVGFPLLCYLC